MTANLEKIFFIYILENPQYFSKIPSENFKISELQYAYDIVKKYYLKYGEVPSPKKTREIIRKYDVDSSKISDEYLHEVFNTDISEYIDSPQDTWLSDNLKAWAASANLKSKVKESLLKAREIDPNNIKNVEETIEHIRELIGDISLLDFDDDIGLDFDDPEAHLQNMEEEKVPTGWRSLDNLLNGGWDKKSLTLFIGESNVGKSLWLGNIAANSANCGQNVVYITCEMAAKKVMKRLGSTRLKIPIDEYDKKSKNTSYIKERIQAVKNQQSSGFDFEENKWGRLFVKEFNTGTATVHDIDNYIKKLKEKENIEIDMIVIDYLTIMAQAVSNKNHSLYLNGKYLAEGVRALGQKHNSAVVSAAQVDRDAFGENEVNAKDVSESKAILETSDIMFGIIRTESMKKEGIYILKLLKIRDGDFKWIKTRFELDKKTLTIENDSPIEEQ